MFHQGTSIETIEISCGDFKGVRKGRRELEANLNQIKMKITIWNVEIHHAIWCGVLCLKYYRTSRYRMQFVISVLVERICAGCKNKWSLLLHNVYLQRLNGSTIWVILVYALASAGTELWDVFSGLVRGYPFRGFKGIGLELDICQTKLLNHFFSFQLKVWQWRKWIA